MNTEKKFKKLKSFFLSLLSLLSFQLTSCKEETMETMPFKINWDAVKLDTSERLLLVKNVEELNDFITDETIFDPDPS